MNLLVGKQPLSQQIHRNRVNNLVVSFHKLLYMPIMAKPCTLSPNKLTISQFFYFEIVNFSSPISIVESESKQMDLRVSSLTGYLLWSSINIRKSQLTLSRELRSTSKTHTLLEISDLFFQNTSKVIFRIYFQLVSLSDILSWYFLTTCVGCLISSKTFILLWSFKMDNDNKNSGEDFHLQFWFFL